MPGEVPMVLRLGIRVLRRLARPRFQKAVVILIVPRWGYMKRDIFYSPLTECGLRLELCAKVGDGMKG